MKHYCCIFTAGLLTLLVSAESLLAEKPAGKEQSKQIRGSVELGLKLVQKAAANYPKHRKCFSCHHQTLPLLAMKTARTANIEIDEGVRQSQLKFTRSSFGGGRNNLKKGQRIGGGAMTVGYGLWTFSIVDVQPDDLTTDMVTFLLKTQKENGSWRSSSNRPPLEESHVSCTVLAAYGMKTFAAESQQADVEKSMVRAKRWLKLAPLKSHEDKVSRLWGLQLLDGNAEELEVARKMVVEAQRDDGGWSQLAEMESDAYATGQTLFVLQETGMVTSSPTIQRGIEFLLKTQQEDGSWFVKTRSKPIQKFFENGDPHGKSQFISTAATSWAVSALAKSLSVSPSEQTANE